MKFYMKLIFIMLLVVECAVFCDAAAVKQDISEIASTQEELKSQYKKDFARLEQNARKEFSKEKIEGFRKETLRKLRAELMKEKLYQQAMQFKKMVDREIEKMLGVINGIKHQIEEIEAYYSGKVEEFKGQIDSAADGLREGYNKINNNINTLNRNYNDAAENVSAAKKQIENLNQNAVKKQNVKNLGN